MSAYTTLTAAVSALLTTAVTNANTALTNRKVRTDVVNGLIKTADRPMVAYQFIGSRTWEANTFGVTQEQWGFRIEACCPYGIAATPSPSDVDTWIGEVTAAIRAALWGSAVSTAAFTGKGIDLTDAVVAEDTIAGKECRVVSMDLWCDMANVASIA